MQEKIQQQNQVVPCDRDGNEQEQQKKSNEKRRWIIQRTTVVDDEEEKTIQLQILFDPIVSSLTHGLCLTLSFIRSLVSWSDEPLVCVVEQCWKRNSVCCCRCWLLVFLLIQLFGFSLLFLTLLTITSIQYTFCFGESFSNLFFLLLSKKIVSLWSSVYRWCSACEDVNVELNKNLTLFTYCFFPRYRSSNFVELNTIDIKFQRNWSTRHWTEIFQCPPIIV